MQALRFCLTFCFAVLLSGCTPKMAFLLFNYTGQSITVLDYNRSVIPAGGHKEISYFGTPQQSSDLRGPVVQVGNHHWFYPVSTIQRGLLSPPPAYQRDIGLSRGYYVALDERGSLYLLTSASQSLASARASQPAGFPLKPQ